MDNSGFIERRPFFYIGLIGILLIIFGLGLPKFFPKEAGHMPEGFSTPIIYFEFIESPVEVNDFFGINEDGLGNMKFVNQMDKGNRIDFAFAFVYAAFLFLFFQKLSSVSDLKWFKIGMLLAVLSFIFDYAENIQLLGITANLENGNYLTQLSLLKIFTWIKWFSLAISFAIFSVWLFKFKGIYRLMAYVALLPLLLGLLAFIKRGLATELFSKSISIMFFVTICYCFLYTSEANEPKSLLNKED
jgi:hypothetical protein